MLGIFCVNHVDWLIKWNIIFDHPKFDNISFLIVPVPLPTINWTLNLYTVEDVTFYINFW